MPGALTPIVQWLATKDGIAAPGAKLYTYLSGTSTPQSVYTTAAIDVAHTNPVIADADGLFPVMYLAAVSYRMLMTDADGVTIMPAQDDVYDFGQTQGTSVLQQTVTIDAAADYDLTFPDAMASGVLESNGAGELDIVADAAGVLQSDGVGARAFTASPTLAVPVISDRIDLAGGQVAFPATQDASTNVNTLDDYEEFTWTPILGGSGGQSGQTYGSQHGEGVKIGRMVFCTCTITLSAKGTITGQVVIKGLPYAVDTSADSACAFGDFDAAATNQVWVAGIIGADGWVLLRNKDAAGLNMGSMDTSDITNDTACEAIFYYMAAA